MHFFNAFTVLSVRYALPAKPRETAYFRNTVIEYASALQPCCCAPLHLKHRKVMKCAQTKNPPTFLNLSIPSSVKGTPDSNGKLNAKLPFKGV